MAYRTYVANKLDKPVYVFVSPNQDYLIADLVVGLASLAYNTGGLVTTTKDLYMLIKLASMGFAMGRIAQKVKDAITENSLQIPAKGVKNVYEHVVENPLNYLSPSGWAAITGGATLTLTVIDGDFTRAVQFNANPDHSWIATEKGIKRSEGDVFNEVKRGLLYWNGGMDGAGFEISDSPALVTYQNKHYCFTGHRGGNAILMSEFKDGKFSMMGYTGHDARGSVAAVAFRDGLNVFACHAVGNQLFSISSANADLTGWKHAWLKTEIQQRPAGASLKDTYMCCIGIHAHGNGMLWTTHTLGKGWEHGYTGMDTSAPPALIAYKGEFHLYFRHRDGNAIYHGTSPDGITWTFKGNIGLDTSRGVALTEFKGKLYIFFRDLHGSGVFHASSEDGQSFVIPEEPYIGLDIETEPACLTVGNTVLVAGRDSTVSPSIASMGLPQPRYTLMYTTFTPA